jgi:hypothetical protein
MQKKHYLDQKIERYYWRLIDDCFGKEMPIVIRQVEERPDIDAIMAELATGEVVGSKRKPDDNIEKPVIKITFQHKEQLQTIIIDDKAENLYRFALNMANQMGHECYLLQLYDSKRITQSIQFVKYLVEVSPHSFYLDIINGKSNENDVSTTVIKSMNSITRLSSHMNSKKMESVQLQEFIPYFISQ